MLVSQVSLIFVMLNFEEFLNTLVHFSSSSHDDLVNIVCKIFVAVSFFISVVTAFLEGVGHLWNRHFVHQSTKQVVQPTNQPVEETNATSIDALVADLETIMAKGAGICKVQSDPIHLRAMAKVLRSESRLVRLPPPSN